jgi:predicted transcriptional regulator
MNTFKASRNRLEARMVRISTMADPAPFVFSIRPIYVAMFFSGRKQVEFRTRRPSLAAGDTVLVYETAPTSAIVATAVASAVHVGSPARVWDLAGERGGITKAEFDHYFAKREVAVAIEIDVTKLSTAVPLPPGMAAPQAWARWRGEWPLRVDSGG